MLYLVDISEQCGFSIQQQFDLFASIRPLFHNKPLVVGTQPAIEHRTSVLPPSLLLLTSHLRCTAGAAVNKVDQRSPSDLSSDERAALAKLEASGAAVKYMSTFTEEGTLSSEPNDASVGGRPRRISRSRCDLAFLRNAFTSLRSHTHL